jgi:hypothetical protein
MRYFVLTQLMGKSGQSLTVNQLMQVWIIWLLSALEQQGLMKGKMHAACCMHGGGGCIAIGFEFHIDK